MNFDYQSQSSVHKPEISVQDKSSVFLYNVSTYNYCYNVHFHYNGDHRQNQSELLLTFLQTDGDHDHKSAGLFSLTLQCLPKIYATSFTSQYLHP